MNTCPREPGNGTWGQTGRTPVISTNLGITKVKTSGQLSAAGSSLLRSYYGSTAAVVVADVAHHITERGNARQIILSSDADRLTYLELLREYSRLYGLRCWGTA